VSGDEAVVAAYRRLAGRGAGVLVQPQLAGVEMAVGGLGDADFGPVVMVASGGVAVEVLGDTAFAVAPVHHVEAVALINGLAGYPLLTGWRGAETVDVDALAAAVVAVSRLVAAHPEVVAVDLNPVLVSSVGAVAVDWKVIVGDRPGGGEEKPS
jgi:acetyltransferase